MAASKSLADPLQPMARGFPARRQDENPLRVRAPRVASARPAAINGQVSAWLVVAHPKSESEWTTAALAHGVEALDWERFVVELNRGK